MVNGYEHANFASCNVLARQRVGSELSPRPQQGSTLSSRSFLGAGLVKNIQMFLCLAD